MNQYVSAILNFQAGRNRPIEYYTTPINDFSEHQKNLVVYVDDWKVYNKLSSQINRVLIDYEQVSNIDFEASWRAKFLANFKQDVVWYNLSRTYLLKPKLLKMASECIDADRYIWLDAGMPCSHVFGHDFGRYHNVYSPEIIAFMDEVFTANRFLSQGWVVNTQSGVNMEVVYKAFNLDPDGREHISGCVFAMERSMIDKFNHDFYAMLARFHEINFMGTDENVYIADF